MEKINYNVRRLETYRLRLPKEWCKKYNIESNDLIDILEKNNSLVLTKHTDVCLFCGKEKKLVEYNGTYLICNDCLKGLIKEYSDIKGE